MHYFGIFILFYGGNTYLLTYLPIPWAIWALPIPDSTPPLPFPLSHPPHPLAPSILKTELNLNQNPPRARSGSGMEKKNEKSLGWWVSGWRFWKGGGRNPIAPFSESMKENPNCEKDRWLSVFWGKSAELLELCVLLEKKFIG